MNKFKLEKVNGRNCKENARVALAFPNPSYTIDGNNPSIGSVFECVGTIRYFIRRNNLSSTAVNIAVNWDNGCHNYYTEDELVFVEGKEDRSEYESIWD